ncbi:MAG: head-tail adaptor protein [Rhodobacteraceae bacterium]|jgi:head-tail adaptor|nr:head-tail adaptor protein [Paracoccaceae bacterium]
MSAPRLNRQLVLETATRTPDGAGGFSRIWTAIGTLWAEVRSRSGREVGGGETTLSRVAYRITVRASPVGAASRPAPGQRFRDGSRLFLIRAVTEQDQEGRYLLCFADEEVVT